MCWSSTTHSPHTCLVFLGHLRLPGFTATWPVGGGAVLSALLFNMLLLFVLISYLVGALGFLNVMVPYAVYLPLRCSWDCSDGSLFVGLLWTPFHLKLACGVHFDALVDSESVPPWRSSTDCFS